MLRYFGRKAFAIALINFLWVFRLPSRNDWRTLFTDIAVGSLSVALVALPWCLMTPLSDRIIALFDRYLPGKKQQALTNN